MRLRVLAAARLAGVAPMMPQLAELAWPVDKSAIDDGAEPLARLYEIFDVQGATNDYHK